MFCVTVKYFYFTAFSVSIISKGKYNLPRIIKKGKFYLPSNCTKTDLKFCAICLLQSVFYPAILVSSKSGNAIP